MQPVRSFNFQNSTGVPIRVKWRQGRQSTSVELPPGMASNRHHLTQAPASPRLVHVSGT